MHDNKTYFSVYQKTLCKLANTKAGRHLLGADGFPIVKVTENSYHQLIDIQKDKYVLRAGFFTYPRLKELFEIPLTKMDIAKEYIQNPYEAFLHYTGLEEKRKVYPQIYLTTSTFATASSGRTRNNNAVYLTSRNATTAGGAVDGLVIVEHSLGGGSHFITRGFYTWDTSSLPDSVTSRDSGFVRFIGAGVATVNGDTETVHIVSNNQASNTALVADDYDQSGLTSYGSLALASYNTTNGTNNDIALDATGLGLISLTGYSKFAARMGKDISATVPTGDNSFQAQTDNVLLSFTYTAPIASGMLLSFEI